MKKTYIKSTITLAGRINTANKATVGTIFSVNSSPLISVTCTQFYTSNFVWSQRNNQSNRRYSINTTNRDANPMPIVPILSYSNADTMKPKIFKDNRNKTGIYR
jgi:hypothetical protein